MPYPTYTQNPLAGNYGGMGNLGPTMSYGIGQDQIFAQEHAKKMQDSQIQASLYPAQLQQGRFNTIMPYLTGALSTLQSSVGGQSGPSPDITVGPIWSPQQTQQQVNAARGQGDQSTATRIRGMQNQMGARGFGSSSPLAAALQAQYQNQNLATNTSNERQIRQNATQQNASHLFQTQMGREQQFGSRQQEDIERRRTFQSSQNALLAALAGLV